MRSAPLLSYGLLLGMAMSCSNQQAPSASVPATVPPSATAGSAAPPAATALPSPQAAPQKPAPLATAEGPFSGVRVEVTELKRTTGETLSLRFTIINDSNRPLRVPDVGVSSAALVQDSSYTISGVHLIDLVGKKKYFVAKDSAGACVCSRFDSIPAGRGANHWARFSAPPDDVAKLSIVIPSFSPVDDVPVSR